MPRTSWKRLRSAHMDNQIGHYLNYEYGFSQGWELLHRFPPFHYFPNFSTSPNYMLAIEYHVQIWQVSPQFSCGDICPIWMRFKECNRYFYEIENFAYGEIDEQCRKISGDFITPTGTPMWVRWANDHTFTGQDGSNELDLGWIRPVVAEFWVRKVPRALNTPVDTPMWPQWANDHGAAHLPRWLQWNRFGVNPRGGCWVPASARFQELLSRPCGCNGQMVMTLHIYRPWRFQWTNLI